MKRSDNWSCQAEVCQPKLLSQTHGVRNSKPWFPKQIYLRASGHAADPKNIDFYRFFIVFFGFLVIFIENDVFICGNWVGMTAEWSRIYLEVISVLGSASKVDFGPQN